MIRIMTDTAADFTIKEANDLGIRVIPIKTRINGVEYRDLYDISKDEFFRILPTLKELPKTSMINPFEFEEIFNEYPNDDIILITLSSELSGTYKSALTAKGNRDNIYVIDGLNATVGQNIIVRRALELKEEGIPAKRIAEIIEREKHEVKLIAVVETLDYLKKGGRINAATAFIGNMLLIKPVIEVKNGKVVVVGKARGAKNARNKLREFIKENPVDFSRPFRQGYSGLDRSNFDEYVNESKDIYGDLEITCMTIGSTIGTHVGPGAVAVAYFSKK